MDYEWYGQVFRDEYLTAEDLVTFATVLNLFNTQVGSKNCWCIKEANHPGLKNFTISHPSRPQYKGRDARILLLALVDEFWREEKPVIIRKSICNSIYCLNPNHYFYGTKADVQLERFKRSGHKLDTKIIEEIRNKREKNPKYWTYKELSKYYKLPYHTVSRICRRVIYDH